ncbi:hypothetical protein C8F04DRAFT_1092658 [Mycena alexandri]|uniref:Glycoside hydrolase family 78 protein n=1 Tax=Mycena alexandri TaxID=1745969 RepID=A0AAD6T2B5_9AGAR|nr:hypothetical protein C8F04DRAFT_1092658 [Mycena alexandri]
MFLSALPLFVFVLVVVFCPSAVIGSHSPPTGDARAILGKRDAFSDTGLSSASWIWLPEPDLLVTAPTGDVAFIKTFATPAGKNATSALIALTVDNNFTVWLNGQPIGASDPEGENGWVTAHVFSVAFNTSANVLSVLGANANPASPGANNPAGLLAAIRILYTDGSSATVLSDSTWLASGSVPSDFPLPADLSPFVNAQIAAKYGSGSWATSVGLPSPKPNPLDLTGSLWVWSVSNASIVAPVGNVGFRKSIPAAANKIALSATVLLSVDNTFDLWVNGQYIGSPPFDNNANVVASWAFAQRFKVTLTESTNIFTVIGKNFASQANATLASPAGLVAAVQVEYQDGSSDTFRSDASWLTGPVASSEAFIALPDSALVPSIPQGPYGILPWSQIGVSDALSVLNLPQINASTAAAGSSNTHPAPASTTILPTSTPSGENGASTVSSAKTLTLVFAWCIITGLMP